MEKGYIAATAIKKKKKNADHASRYLCCTTTITKLPFNFATQHMPGILASESQGYNNSPLPLPFIIPELQDKYSLKSLKYCSLNTEWLVLSLFLLCQYCAVFLPFFLANKLQTSDHSWSLQTFLFQKASVPSLHVLVISAHPDFFFFYQTPCIPSVSSS